MLAWLRRRDKEPVQLKPSPRDKASQAFAKLIAEYPNFEVAMAIEGREHPLVDREWAARVRRAYEALTRFLSPEELVRHHDLRLELINKGPGRVIA